jgi:hypothetical protein
VLATKLELSNSGYVNDMVYGSGYANVYTGDEESLAQEAGFVKDVLGAGPDDLVVIMAGPVPETEQFFEELGDVIRGRHSK